MSRPSSSTNPGFPAVIPAHRDHSLRGQARGERHISLRNSPMSVSSGRRYAPTDVVTTGSGLPGRGVIYGPEGTGKTSLGCAYPSAIVLMARGETGLRTLIDSGRVPETP